ncbi:MAG: alanine racemase [Rhodospirillaceae bacterium]|nr:alanine racemase [Rhodospirillaceae bacterium]MDD9916038.1 alanine racemase [Rhodospirillaceae bacterium]
MDQDLVTHPAWMEFDLDALAANFKELERRVGPDVKIIASLKANAYGHGAVETAKVLFEHGVFALSTGSFRDAMAIREAGVTTPILMFGGNLPEATTRYLEYDLIPTVYNMETARAVSEAATAPVPVYIKVDAGMGRLGIELGVAEKFIREVSTFNNIKIEGVYTHLSFKDAKGQEWSKRGIERFNRLNDRLRDGGLDIPVTQAVASANLMVGHMDGSNAICPGALLYGLSAVNPDLAPIEPFRPVLTAIKARLIHVGAFPDDPALKEGGYHTVRQSDRTGVVPLGLYDGYRKAQGGAPSAVLINGKRRPVLGVSLEHLTFDLLGDETVKVGDTVTVLGADGGDEITLAEMAGWQGTGLNDLLMNFDGRLPGRYRGG